MQRHVVLVGSILLCLWFPYAVVQADCSTTTPVDGATVDCNAPLAELDTVGTGAENNVTVNIETGAAIDTDAAGESGINLNNNATVNNQGAIDQNAGAGVNINTGTIINEGSINANKLGGIVAFGGDVINNGTIDDNFNIGVSGSSGVISNSGSVSNNLGGITVFDAAVNNSGTVGHNTAFGIAATQGSITNSGSVSNNGAVGISTFTEGDVQNTGVIVDNGGVGILVDDLGNVSNNGTIAGNAAGGVQIRFTNPTTANTFTNGLEGSVIGTTGLDAVQMGGGKDTAILYIGSTLVGILNGGGDNDSLTFYLQSENPDELASFESLMQQMLVSDNQLTYNGQVYEWSNFEQLSYILELIIKEAGGYLPMTNLICDDGVTKWFRAPAGDIEAYSGFNLLPENGFLVGKILMPALPTTLHFQDVGGKNPNWGVQVTALGNNVFVGQIFDDHHVPVGKECRFTK